MALASELRSRGWNVDTSVGRSGFTIDAAIRGQDGYRLGVMIDPSDPATSELATETGTATTTAAGATGRLVSEAGVLRAFGWPITRFFVTEWLEYPDLVVDRIELLLRASVRQHPSRAGNRARQAL